jgi:hypothetical protein
MTTTIINKARYFAEYADESSSSLLFPSKLYDCVGYVDTTKLRKKLALKGRGRVMAVLVNTKDDPDFINVSNKDITFKTPLLCSLNDDGVFRGKYQLPVYNHPLGNVIVVLNE